MIHLKLFNLKKKINYNLRGSLRIATFLGHFSAYNMAKQQLRKSETKIFFSFSKYEKGVLCFPHKDFKVLSLTAITNDNRHAEDKKI